MVCGSVCNYARKPGKGKTPTDVPVQPDIGKAAGFLRNEQMARYTEALVAIWDQTTTVVGTLSTGDRARAGRAGGFDAGRNSVSDKGATASGVNNGK
jgi:hypothetical protein